ncbi:uncharacterized protein V1510DRAFT_378000 [Dipodascopsis tothii]|uniref:uncharacterized protein n=1 Tax=Dipodascopsis tothii TaxID=44089 RepID=UPI0034CD2578
MGDAADPTDWAATAAPEVAAVETALQCRICKEFFSAPVMTECAHTFCSLCIRKCIAATPTAVKPACPLCRADVSELKLRKNQVVEEMVEAYVRVRATLLGLAGTDRAAPAGPAEPAAPAPAAPAPAATAAASRPRRAASADSSPSRGQVACPICGRRMAEGAVNRHLDVCLSGPGPPEEPRPAAFFGAPRAAPIQRLPKLQYDLLNEAKLRAKLTELGLPSLGPKADLQRRHTEWVSLWNANADAAQPKTKTQLLRELAAWEAALGRPRPSRVPDEDLQAWGQKHAADFRELTAAARKRVRREE